MTYWWVYGFFIIAVNTLFVWIIVCFVLGEYYLFCKGADSSIFPRVVSGKVEQVKARVEHNAVVSRNQKHLHLLSYFSRAIYKSQKHLPRSWWKKAPLKCVCLCRFCLAWMSSSKRAEIGKYLNISENERENRRRKDNVSVVFLFMHSHTAAQRWSH